MKKPTLYPLQFVPILKEKIWGGQKLTTYLNKKSKHTNLGESWEISDVEGDTSIVAHGSLKGKSLAELLKMYKEEFLGEQNYKRFQDTFPLLIKFIDAKTDLSIQLHPNDDLAKQRHQSLGKTEMWYVMQADKNANLIVGFNRHMTKQNYLKHLKNKSLPSILNFDTVKPGNAYFIKAGLVHAIGAGVMLAEIQQTSDVTYRLYDWDRVDDQNKPRALHTDLALDAINFKHKNDYKATYSKTKNAVNTMISCSYFTTNYIELNTNKTVANTLDSFMIYICVEGTMRIKTKESTLKLSKGETVLIPASITNYTIHTEAVKLLQVYV